MKKLILLITLIYFYSGIAVPAQPLKGTVSIDVGKKMKPLDPLLWPGNYFDRKVATALLKDESANTSIWKKIPEWQAGEWEFTQATNTKVVEYINGLPHAATPKGVYSCKSVGLRGWQRDINGQIWDWYQSGCWIETEYDDYITHSFVKFTAPGTDEYSDMYEELINFSVDKSTNKILLVRQEKRWDRITYLSSGLFKEEEVHTRFDEKGKPLVTSWNTELQRRTKNFAESEILLATDTQVQQEIQQDFFNYLKNNGLANLIPANKDSGSNKGKMADNINVNN